VSVRIHLDPVRDLPLGGVLRGNLSSLALCSFGHYRSRKKYFLVGNMHTNAGIGHVRILLEVLLNLILKLSIGRIRFRINMGRLLRLLHSRRLCGLR